MSFNESAFRGRIDQVLEQVKRVLDTARNPHLASDVQVRGSALSLSCLPRQGCCVCCVCRCVC